jgi:serine/threonine-protein kinase HipA
LLVTRFDRPHGHRRAFLSAMAMLGAAEGDDPHSYLELADAIRAHGERVDENLEQLWRRMLFNVLVSNTDDHLRNHGFCRARSGWVLAPAYDLNPMPVDVRPRAHSLLLDEESAEASAARVTDVAGYFGLDEDAVRDVTAAVVASVAQWRDVAREHGLTRREIDRMASAFEHDDLRWAEERAR